MNFSRNGGIAFFLLSLMWNLGDIILLCISGLDKIEFLQSHENMEIYQKAFDIIEHYFGGEEEDSRVAPSVDQDAQQYHFNADQSVPMGGFQFWTGCPASVHLAPVG